MTPKSLLRHKRCISNINDFTKKNSFHRVLEDHAYQDDSNLIKLSSDNKIKKWSFVLEKIYFDLLDAREKVKIIKLFLSGLSSYILSQLKL